jgi:glycosyltransferase involved in cell wall biosynthesis
VFGTFCGARPQGLWRRPLRPLALRLCAGLAICARCEAERVIARYGVPAAKVALMYYPLDFSVWHPSKKEEARALLGIPPDAQVVLYHGAILLWTKGLAVLMEAWERICQDRPGRDLRLILIGTGVDAPQLTQTLATKRLRGVQWLNQWVQDRGLIQRYLSAADVYVFPSRSDACPVSVIEAMACGLPVVASQIRGIPDLLPQGERSGGLLVPPGDVDALAREVERLLDDRGLAQELGRRALYHAETSFSMESIGKQLRAFLVADRQ